jgi:predicted Rossmann-fold nucleotide-binding protein
MNDLCDGVIALPGGFGTLGVWNVDLGTTDFIKNNGILNTNGFYDALLVLIQTMVDKGFWNQATKDAFD